MKKFFGIIFLLAGLAGIVLGIAALTNITTRNNSFEGRLGNEFSREYRSNSSEQQIIGIGLAGGGLVFFIIGIVMVATKSGSQRRKESELAVLKKMQTIQTPVVTVSQNQSQTSQSSALKKYFINDGAKQEGPYSFDELLALKISKETPVWYEGLSEWSKAGKIEELKSLFIITPPPFKKETVTPPPFVEKIKTQSEDSKKIVTPIIKVNNTKKRSVSKIILYVFIVLAVICVAILIAIMISDTNNNSGNGSNNNSNEDTYEEKVMTVEEEEAANPTRFLHAEGTYKENFWGDKIKITCEITNDATVATYKDAVIEFTYYSKSGTELGTERQTVYEKFSPGSTKSINMSIPNYENVNSINWEVVDAIPK